MNNDIKPTDGEVEIQRKVRGRLKVVLDAMVSPHTHGYQSKAYRAYVQRIRDFYCPAVHHAGDALQQLGAALAESVAERMESPGFVRLVFAEDDYTKKWKAKRAEIQSRVASVLDEVLPYSRHYDYSVRAQYPEVGIFYNTVFTKE